MVMAAVEEMVVAATEDSDIHMEWLRHRVPAKHFDNLVALLTAPDRYYHGIGHIETLWQRHLDHGGSPDNDIIAFAIAYHDAIYDARRSDNEQRSALLWAWDCAEASHPHDVGQAVLDAILATAKHPYQGEAQPHVLWMVDLDLLGLASDRDDFMKDTAAVALEMPWVEPAAFAAGRKAFFAKMLEAPRLYRTPALFETYEEKARANLRAAIAGEMDQ